MSKDVAFGPKMQALNERQQKFVVALFTKGIPPKHHGRHVLAARVAGYGNKQGTSTAAYFTVISSQLLASPKIQAAIEEYARGAVRAMAPEAVVAVLGLLEDRKHRDHAKVALAVMEKFDPTPRAPLIAIQNNTYTPPTEQATAAVMQRIAELARQAGMPQLPAPIDADFSEVKLAENE
jgi:phage terminase small subunit